MTDTSAVRQDRSLIGLLLRVRARSIWNLVVQTTAEAPIRVSVAGMLVIFIWLGLYSLFLLVFRQFDERTRLETTVAIPLVFNFFFVAMLAMLTFSNAIIAHGALFSRRESEYLLASPLSPADLVTVKFVESLAFSSWSLILLGLPLMAAMADRTPNPLFHLVFIAFFLFFIPIPGALGLLLAWLSAQYFPRRLVRGAAVIASLGLLVLIVIGFRSLKMDEVSETWLRTFLDRMSFVEHALLPNRWIAKGIDHALNQRTGEAVQYLAVTGANALFFSWLAVWLVSRKFHHAYDRATSGSQSGRRPAAKASGGICGWAFFYLPLRLRLIAAKDLRTFLRDPLQWSQLLILFGLIILYLTNMPHLDLNSGAPRLLIPFLNLCAISLILATFTCRFVFPLVSLEGQQLWLIGLLPMSRGQILLSKFAFAMTVTLFVTGGSTALAIMMLDLGLVWSFIHIATTISVCFGLCGLAVGLGARLPMFNQSNAARIANGMGGTANLLASLAMVTLVLTAVGYGTWRAHQAGDAGPPELSFLLPCAASWLIAITAGAAAMIVGARHFHRLET